ncbi:Zinc finger protein 358 [Portunus trituberculatus]|uniref:Zinc finger protein 358 n=1 Tax=Portunus trituberculatus TaxID=210409 RepID=A0A5B7HFZ8_PORTR|nr:Zinc finger protein 358 [Portunus trituberculatus]
MQPVLWWGMVLIKATSLLVSRAEPRYKPYKCPHCLKTYSSKSNLNTHVRDLHAAVPQVFVCPYCKKRYSSKNSLRYHITMYHREEKNRDQALQHAIATAQPLSPAPHPPQPQPQPPQHTLHHTQPHIQTYSDLDLSLLEDPRSGLLQEDAAAPH